MLIERKLASIQKILKIEPIEGANNIELATILGWECIVKIGEFKVGDLCIYFEIDSRVPDHPIFEYMRPRKFHVKTIRMLKKVYSQGMALPFNILANFDSNYHLNFYKEDDDVTNIIGVTLYIRNNEDEGEFGYKENMVLKYLLRNKYFNKMFFSIVPPRTKSCFPNFIPQTDLYRLSSHPRLLKTYNSKEFDVTEKLDGKSATFFYNHALSGKKFGFMKYDITEGFGVCSKSVRRIYNDNSAYWEISELYSLDYKLRQFYKEYNINLAIQGEIIGVGIEKNRYHLKTKEFYVFKIFDIDKQVAIVGKDLQKICKILSLKQVPVIMTIKILDFTVKDFIAFSKFNSYINNKVVAEGIVCCNDTVSFKVINPAYLLQHDI